MKWWIDASYFKDDHIREMSSKILESIAKIPLYLIKCVYENFISIYTETAVICILYQH